MHTRGSLTLIVTVGLFLFSIVLTAEAAGPRPVYQPPQRYYLALGDSMAYGFQPNKAKPGARPSDFNTGYVDVFARETAEALAEDRGRQLRLSR